MKQVVVLGAGFAGASATKTLLRRLPSDVSLTLANPLPFMTFKPLLHEVATGMFGPWVVQEPLERIFRHPRFTFVQGSAQEINLSAHTVAVGKKKLLYDYLVVATGSTSNFFGISGAREHALNLESVDDAQKIKAALISLSGSSSPFRIVVVGAGPTGCELSAEVAQFVRTLRSRSSFGNSGFSLTLIDRSSVLLPAMDSRLRAIIQSQLSHLGIELLLGVGVTRVLPKGVVTDTKGTFPADLIVWAAGVMPSPLAFAPSSAAAPAVERQGDYLLVDKFLRLKGHSTVFVAGDCALVVTSSEGRVPLLAQSAVQEGIAAGRNLLATLAGRPLKPFVFRQKGFVLPLGKGAAAAHIGPLIFSGFLAWWINRTVYLLTMFSLSHRLSVAVAWTVGLFRKRS